MKENHLLQSMTDLIKRTSTILAPDMMDALMHAQQSEASGSIARQTMDIIVKSAQLSAAMGSPVCQDTGTLLCIIETKTASGQITEAIKQAARDLTEKGILRQNCVNPLTQENTGDNIGVYVPQIHIHPSDGPERVHLMLKGGGSENVGIQYSLPDNDLDAGRSMTGVKTCLMDAVHQAQGKGCAPGILGVCIGGDRASGYLIAKQQLFRRLDDTNSDPLLSQMENEITLDANSLGIGPMGLGGKTTLLGTKIAAAGRHPACFYVTVSYSCWATRRYCVELDKNGEINRWL
ncbi:MAG: fumarate hydratase [Thermodesulfobacteriota bacterium]|nr:fumarate hydratase [Thermodesulfobacteriota bacterium]